MQSEKLTDVLSSISMTRSSGTSHLLAGRRTVHHVDVTVAAKSEVRDDEPWLIATLTKSSVSSFRSRTCTPCAPSSSWCIFFAPRNSREPQRVAHTVKRRTCAYIYTNHTHTHTHMHVHATADHTGATTYFHRAPRREESVCCLRHVRDDL